MTTGDTKISAICPIHLALFCLSITYIFHSIPLLWDKLIQQIESYSDQIHYATGDRTDEMIVTEIIDTLPCDEEVISVKREEKLLLDVPDPGPRQLWRECEPLGIVNMPMHYIAAEFSTPKGVFENEQIHIEWQQLNGRQPFYHRNQDCDEIAYHVCGNRTILTGARDH